MPRMMVTCKSCGKDFASGIQMDEISFKTATLTNNSEQCPHCGKSNSYSKPDVKFK